MKVTLIFVIILINTLTACYTQTYPDHINIEQSMDSIASIKIDSAYRQIQLECDSAFQHRLPLIVDSLIKTDSL